MTDNKRYQLVLKCLIKLEKTSEFDGAIHIGEVQSLNISGVSAREFVNTLACLEKDELITNERTRYYDGFNSVRLTKAGRNYFSKRKKGIWKAVRGSLITAAAIIAAAVTILSYFGLKL